MAEDVKHSQLSGCIFRRVQARGCCANHFEGKFLRLSAAIPVRVIAEEERRQENTLEQVDAGAADNSVCRLKSDIDTGEIDNKSIKNDSDLANQISPQTGPQIYLASDMSPDSEQATKAAASEYQRSDSATSGSVVLTVEWNDPVLGQPTNFHVSATGGSGSFLSACMRPRTLTPMKMPTSQSPTQAA